MANEMLLFVLLVSAFIATGALTFLCIRYHLRLRQVRRRLQVSERRLGRYRQRLSVLRGRLLGEPSYSGGGDPEGQPVLEAAGEEFPATELRLRLQRGQSNPSGIVERYRLVGNMARRGLSAADISAILQLPPGETEELLKLAEVGKVK